MHVSQAALPVCMYSYSQKSFSMGGFTCDKQTHSVVLFNIFSQVFSKSIACVCASVFACAHMH